MTEEVSNDVGEEEAATQQEGTEEAPQLSFADIGAIVSVIDICSKRGAFEGTELEQVGMLRRRVTAFLDHVAPQPPAEADGEAASEEPAVEEDSSAA